MVVYLVIRSERYGFGTDDPIAFETFDEADEYIKHSEMADNLAYQRWSFKLIPTPILSRHKREENLARIQQKLKDKEQA